MPLQITGDVPVVGIVREVGESWRQFREIEGVIASIELENVQSGNSKLFMHVADDGKYALGCDLIAPDGFGEIIGGGQREESAEVLLKRILEHKLDPKNY